MAVIGKWMGLFGEAIYLGKPHAARCSAKKNFVLKGDGYLYFFIHDLAKNGDENVTVGTDYQGAHVFNGVTESVEQIEWMDNGNELDFVQKGNIFSFNASGYPYGMSSCVRVAKAKIKE